ncbi:hypothetical protein KQ940_22505 [Marinobacterium sp. D7]|uniref:hypothetical protein n=1 Tax=Marinobacterium ramblicola TaxID=2849041 RepID=UPI001C2CE07F|nr:hypothetical protein [Marinobacterium ramblicola]MBV1790536.1 hypothetical protein [Marinobacterium ramblicola]MBV1790843.1 hypothetical protein [Marinobacterium ramblicola]
MKNNGNCFLCLREAHIEDVPHEHGQYLDVLCSAECPQYQISTNAKDEVATHPLKREIVLQEIKKIANQGKKPVVAFDSNKRVFEYVAE